MYTPFRRSRFNDDDDDEWMLDATLGMEGMPVHESFTGKEPP